MKNYLFIILLSFIVFFDFSLCNEFELSCKNDTDCSAFSSNDVKATCVKGECHCVNYLKQKIDCEPQHTKISNLIGEPCPCEIEHTHCDTLSNLCMCNQNYTASIDNRKCLKSIIPLDDGCENNSQCILYDPNSNCDTETHRCECLKNYTEINRVCHPVVGLNMHCETSDQCTKLIDHTICNTDVNRCVCLSGYVSTKNFSKCLPAADYGEDCEETDQCTNKMGSGSVCNNGKCVCLPNHQNATLTSAVRCYQKKAHGDSCRHHNECMDAMEMEQKMECINSQCQCRYGFLEVGRYCEKSAGSYLTVSLQFIYVFMIIHVFKYYCC